MEEPRGAGGGMGEGWFWAKIVTFLSTYHVPGPTLRVLGESLDLSAQQQSSSALVEKAPQSQRNEES